MYNQGYRISVWGQGTLEYVRVRRVNKMGMQFKHCVDMRPRLVKH